MTGAGADGLRGGVRRLLGPAEEVAAGLTGAGWAVARVAPAGSTAALYDALADALALPGWFGRNLDALWDCLTDLEVPTALVLSSWTTYATARPERWSALLDLLRERSTLPPAFLLVLAD